MDNWAGFGPQCWAWVYTASGMYGLCLYYYTSRFIARATGIEKNKAYDVGWTNTPVWIIAIGHAWTVGKQCNQSEWRNSEITLPININYAAAAVCNHAIRRLSWLCGLPLLVRMHSNKHQNNTWLRNWARICWYRASCRHVDFTFVLDIVGICKYNKRSLSNHFFPYRIS